MMKSSHPSLHFRHHEIVDNSYDPDCCSVVDVCVSQDLLGRIRHNRQLTSNGILVRLHWDTRENSHKALSTVTLFKGEKTKTALSPQNAIALATNDVVLHEFASDMFGMYNAKLLAVHYPPLALTFHHTQDDGPDLATSDSNLLGLLRGLVSQCAPSENFTQLSYSINKGLKIPLPRFSICQCLATGKQPVVSKGVQTISTTMEDSERQAAIQSVMYRSKLSVTGATKNTDNNTPRKIEEKFSILERELTEQRTFVESELSEQRKQNDEMKSLMLRLLDFLKKGKPKSDSQISYPGKSMNPILDETDLMQFSLESDKPMKSGLFSDVEDKRRTELKDNRKQTSGNKGLVHDDHKGVDENKMSTTKNDGKEQQKEDDDANDSGKDVDEEEHEEEKLDEKKEEKDVEEEEEEAEKNHQQPRKGPILKEIVGNELRSLSPPRTKAEMKRRSHRGKSSPLQQSHSHPSRSTEGYSQRYNEQGSRPKPKTTSMTGQKRDQTFVEPRDSPYYGDGYGSGDFYYDSYPARSRQSRAAPSTRGGRYQDQSLESQMDDLDDFEMEDMMFGGQRGSSDYYSDLQVNELNFDVTRREPLTTSSGNSGKAEVTKSRLSDDADGEDRMRLLFDSIVGDNPNQDRLWESIEEALTDETQLPYVESTLDTVICMDTSESVKDETFLHMKKIVLDFISGVEDIAEQYELEENIAIVTFGGRARIAHHLSNDYGSLRDTLDDLTPGGPSPLLEGILVSLACLSKGGELNINSCVAVPSRLIIVTDGLATGELPETSGDKYGIDEQQKMLLSNAFQQLRRRQPEDYLQGQVTVVPVGKSNMSFLLSLAKSCGGTLIEGSNMKKLCKHQRLHTLAGETLEKIRRKANASPGILDGLQTLAIYFGSEVMGDGWSEVRDIVQENLDKILIPYGSVHKFINIHETPGLPPLGSRVTRGQDWIWGNQDTEGAGTIFNHGLDGQYLWVVWDYGMTNVYRYGQNGCYDVQVVHDQPREPSTGAAFCTGLQVERGPNWHLTYGSQDGGPGSRGVIIREKPELRRVIVRWQNGNMYEYRYGENNMFDLSILDPLACLLDSSTKA